ncbi:MAG: Gfo/Idh/MocA family oxidoreductase [Planctomycetaceae bacterium]
MRGFGLCRTVAGWCLVLLLGVAVAPSVAQPVPRQLRDFPDWTTSVAISPDSTTVAAGSYDVVKVAPLAELTQPTELKTNCGFAQAALFTRDGTQLVIGGYQQVQVWDVANHQRLHTLKGHKGYVRDLALNPAGDQLASASEDRTVRIWQLKDGTALRKIGPLELPVLGVAWSPDGLQLATAEGDETRLTKPGLVKLWNAETGELIRTFPEHEKGATDVVFSPDGTQLLSTSLDEKVNVYDVTAGTAVGFYGGHSRPTNCVVLASGGDIAITGSGGRFKGKNEIKVFHPADGEEVASFDLHQGKVTALALSADGQTLASASYDKTVAIWDFAKLLSPNGGPAETTLAANIDITNDQLKPTPKSKEAETMRIGIIGLDTSHAVAFTKLINAAEPLPVFQGIRIVAAYPQGSPDIESSISRVPGYTEEVKKLGVEIVDSIDELVSRVDAVLLETNDGRPHFEQVLPVLKAKKPVFVDKPIAASLEDAVAILEAARYYGTPCFSSSSLRWMGQVQEVRRGEYGPVVGCDTYSPCSLEATHPDLYWYGIHGVEGLFAVMGTGLKSVARTQTENFEQVTGVWQDGRIGTFRGLRTGARGYGGTAFCEKKTVVLGPYQGYQPLVESIIHFYKTGEAPVSTEETLEIYTFMSASDESQRQGGQPVDVGPVREAATKAAHEKLTRLVPGYKP